MRPMTPALWLLSFIWVIGGSFFLSQLFCGATAGPATATMSIIDGDFKATATGNYAFAKSKHDLTATKDVYNAFTKTGTYLKSNPEKMLLLTGVYSAGENNKSAFANLGVARAEAVKAELVKKGAIGENISTAGEVKDNVGFIENKLYNSVDFKFSEAGAAAAATSAVDNTADNGMTIYFKGDETKLDADNEKIKEIIQYLESYMTTNPDARITVNGHTDNQGKLENKSKIAAARARNVRRIIRDYGDKKVFPSKQVVANSVGPDEPIGSNETEEGISLNNRVTITIE